MIMGHSTKTWDKVYDRNFNARRAGRAVASMDVWRESLLTRARCGEGRGCLQQEQRQEVHDGHLQQRQEGESEVQLARHEDGMESTGSEEEPEWEGGSQSDTEVDCSGEWSDESEGEDCLGDSTGEGAEERVREAVGEPAAYGKVVEDEFAEWDVMIDLVDESD
jgi:hypothetical protein